MRYRRLIEAEVKATSKDLVCVKCVKEGEKSAVDLKLCFGALVRAHTVSICNVNSDLHMSCFLSVGLFYPLN